MPRSCLEFVLNSLVSCMAATQRRSRGAAVGAALSATLFTFGCACRSESKPTPVPDAAVTTSVDAGLSLSLEELRKPEACQACHPAQFAEWAGSMHAYASLDPVFVAMNARGQAETQGQLGDFCVNCHAPMAVAAGLTNDGLNLPDLASEYQGVTCYFCHNVEAVEGDHNNPLRLAGDALMRGPFADPVGNKAHTSAFSPFLDRNDHKSAQLCGACHDVVLDAHALGASTVETKVELEQTYAEWQKTLFNREAARGGLTCNGCHMPISSTREYSATGDDLPKRQSRRHDFEGVDLALVPFPGAERQRLLSQQFLDSSLLGEVCVSRDGIVQVTLENSAGHHWPSGATFDRLGWLDVQAFDDAGLMFRTLDPERDVGETPTDGGLDAAARMPLGSEPRDAAVWNSPFDAGGEAGTPVAPPPVFSVAAPTLTDEVIKANGERAHFFWEIAGIESQSSLPGVITRDPLSPDYHAERRIWQLDSRQQGFDSIVEVRLTVRLRPIKRAALWDLVGSGHLQAQVAQQMPVFDLLPQRCHTKAEVEAYPDVLVGVATDCDPEAPLHSTTLTWRRDEAVDGNRNFRKIVIDGAPALCLAHPTYIPPTP